MPDASILLDDDGEPFGAYVAEPTDPPLGCVLVVQEIFGVNAHVRSVADGWAREGWRAIAPRFFDRLEPGAELPYTPEGTARGRALVDRLGMDEPMRVLRAAARQLSGGLPAAVVGYCWGGSVAMLAATRLGMPAVSYYGGRSVPFLHERAQAPLMFHFGEHDPLIPAQAVARTRAAHPLAAVHVYPAGHGFNRDGSADFEPASAALALERTRAFVREHLLPQAPATGFRALVDEAMSRIRTLSLDDARALHGREDVVFVDLRDVRELERDGTIPGAFHAPRGMLEFWVDPASPYHKPVFDPGKRHVFFCAAGWRSALATEAVRRMGVLPHAMHFEGGFSAWKAAGAPVAPRERSR